MHDIVMRRSPLFFVGDKAKILPQLLSYFPNEIDCYSEPFLGGGSAALNIRARQYFLSDLSSPLVGVHRELRRLALEGDTSNLFATELKNGVSPARTRETQFTLL